MTRSRLEKRRIYSDPACPKCEGVGMYFPEDGNGVTYCDCHKQQKIRAMIQASNISPKNIGCTVSGYVPKTKGEAEG